MKKVFIDYATYGLLMEELVNKLFPERHKYSAIHGLPRGGLAIAVHLSHYLQLPFRLNVTRFAAEFPNGKLLVVDDIIDTGKTFEHFLEIAESQKIQFDTAVLYYKEHSSYEPTFYIRETIDWICFPWELHEEIPNRQKYKSLGGSIDPVDTEINLEEI